MERLRSSCNKQISAYDIQLRNSARFLNSQLLRGSFTRNFSSHNLRNTNYYINSPQHRVSSLTKNNVKNPICMPTDRNNYKDLKTTLLKLQDKIDRAKQILGTTRPKQISSLNVILDYEETISEIESSATKKNQYMHSEIAQNETKLLSFAKNQPTMSIDLGLRKHHKGDGGNSTHKNRLYYISTVLGMVGPDKDKRIEEHLLFSYKIFSSFGKIQVPDYASVEELKQNIPITPSKYGWKTLLLDIDETILHCDEVPKQGHRYDLQLQVQVSNSQKATAYINLRPYALTFLKKVASQFELIAFTASHESYANVVLDELDPDGQIFSHRLYRNSCHQIAQNMYTKDIRILNRKPENIILVDNSPYSYIFQLQNAIPILPYHEGPDAQLPKLEKYLQIVRQCKDVREMNKAMFKFHRYKEYKDIKALIETLYY